MDWLVMIANGLSAAIHSVKGKDGKNMWTAVVQWLTLLVPPMEPIKEKTLSIISTSLSVSLYNNFEMATTPIKQGHWLEGG